MKLGKRIAALSAAVVMMMSMSAMGASAYTNLPKYGTYCTAYKTSTKSVYASTSMINGSKTQVGVNIVINYMKNGKMCTYGSGNAGLRATSTTCNTPSGGKFYSANITHKKKNTIVNSDYIL